MRGTHGSDGGCVRFRLGRQGFGLPLEDVREIAAAGRIAPVPLAPAVVRGLANLRGRVVTLIDVATVFGRPLPPARFPEDRLAILLAAPWEHLGLYVHAPVEIARAAARGVAQPPMTMAAAGGAGGAPHGAAAAAPMAGLASVKGDFIHMVSAGQLIAFCEARVLEGFRRKS